MANVILYTWMVLNGLNSFVLFKHMDDILTVLTGLDTWKPMVKDTFRHVEGIGFCGRMVDLV